MRGPVFWAGVALGALAYPTGCIIGQILGRRSALYPTR